MEDDGNIVQMQKWRRERKARIHSSSHTGTRPESTEVHDLARVRMQRLECRTVLLDHRVLLVDVPQRVGPTGEVQTLLRIVVVLRARAHDVGV